MLRTRLAVAALVAPALFAAGPAHADILRGCYGAVVVVCDPSTSGSLIEYDYVPVPVCVGSCQTVNVPVPGFSDDAICVGWSDQAGNETERCLRRKPDNS